MTGILSFVFDLNFFFLPFFCDLQKAKPQRMRDVFLCQTTTARSFHQRCVLCCGTRPKFQSCTIISPIIRLPTRRRRRRRSDFARDRETKTKSARYVCEWHCSLRLALRRGRSGPGGETRRWASFAAKYPVRRIIGSRESRRRPSKRRVIYSLFLFSSVILFYSSFNYMFLVFVVFPTSALGLFMLFIISIFSKWLL